MPNTHIKADIVEAIQKKYGYPLKQSSEITETLIEIIKRSLDSAEDVMISGFGKFQIKTKKNAEAATQLRMKI